MSSISVQEIQRDPCAFLRRVEAGESFLVLSGEQVLAEVRPVALPPDKSRPYGLCAGEFVVPPGFDQSLPEDVLREFEAG